MSYKGLANVIYLHDLLYDVVNITDDNHKLLGIICLILSMELGHTEHMSIYVGQDDLMYLFGQEYPINIIYSFLLDIMSSVKNYTQIYVTPYNFLTEFSKKYTEGVKFLSRIFLILFSYQREYHKLSEIEKALVALGLSCKAKGEPFVYIKYSGTNYLRYMINKLNIPDDNINNLIESRMKLLGGSLNVKTLIRITNSKELTIKNTRMITKCVRKDLGLKLHNSQDLSEGVSKDTYSILERLSFDRNRKLIRLVSKYKPVLLSQDPRVSQIVFNAHKE